MTIGLYAIVNKHNGRAYIGSSTNVDLRMRHHKCYINTGLFLHYQGYAEDAKTYGVDGFDFKVICETDSIEEAKELETAFLQMWLSDLYNKAPSANGATGIKRDKNIYVKAAEKRLADPSYRGKLSAACKGKRQVLKCPHCSIQGGGGNMRRYHFDKCRSKK
jgi:predicted GIY-YIG superfamily endonuclease